MSAWTVPFESRTCAGCGNEFLGRGRAKWCSERCRRRTCYSGVCVDCGASTYSGDAHPSDRCNHCAPAFHRIWTREALIAAIQAWALETGGIPPVATDWNPPQAISLGHPEKAEKFYADDVWPAASTVQDMFGSWSAAIRAAGYTPRPTGHYGRDGEDAEVCQEIADRYAAGETLEELARAYDCHSATIKYRIHKVGGEIRGPIEAQRLRRDRERMAA